MIVVYILLFILCLSTLIAVHELGHLATAKIFKVYCFEYSLGFGPKLFSKKRKNGETYFSIRAIPFGGFVSMYGENETIPEGIEVDPSRSLLSIRKWKRAIIMVAGVTMNFLLSLVIFFTYELAFPHYERHYAHISVAPDSIASANGLKNDDFVYAQMMSFNNANLVFYDDSAIINYDGDFLEAYVGFNYTNVTIKDTSLVNHALSYEKVHFGEITDYSFPPLTIKEIKEGKAEKDVDYIIKAYYHASGYYEDNGKFIVRISVSDSPFTGKDDEEEKSITEIMSFTFTESEFNKFKETFSLVPMGQLLEMKAKVNIYEDEQGKYRLIEPSQYKFYYPNVKGNNLFTNKHKTLEPKSVSFSIYKQEESVGKGVPVHFIDTALTLKEGEYRLPDNLGISMQLVEIRHGFGESIKNTFVDFGYSSAAIFRGLGQLFTSSDGWQNMGGIIAIGVITTQTLQQNGFGEFLFWWGLISVNLGIINLLPFPGLDGWHLLVIIVEGIFRKEIPAKVKNTVSAIGVFLLLALMVLIVIKDIIAFV